jgi:haloalkane dehalogenase
MVYYTATGSPWCVENTPREENLETLVFLHAFGGGSSAYEWSKVYPAFATEYRIVAPDLIGWGAQSIRAGIIKFQITSQLLKSSFEQTCSGPVTVIASSLTAAFTIRVAIAHPNLFKSLILTTPAGLSDFGRTIATAFAQLVRTPILDRLLYSTGVATSNGIRSFLEQRQFAQSSRVYQEIVEVT